MGDAKFVLKKGGSLGDLYSIKDLQRDSNGNIYVNEKGEVASVASEDIKLGSVFPKCNLSWRNDFKWKNLNFGFMLSARLAALFILQLSLILTITEYLKLRLPHAISVELP
ncbi:hypothetical protein KUBF_29610 [Bacteroides finegoldii]|nr:hypothetical protein KUBF_29610 [Bacteroides finegoldii]